MEYIRTILLVGCRDNRNITITGSEGGSWPLNNIYRTEPVDSVNHQNNSDGEPILLTIVTKEAETTLPVTLPVQHVTLTVTVPAPQPTAIPVTQQ